MSDPTVDEVLALLRTGTPEERVEFVKGLPPNDFTDLAIGLVGSTTPGMVVVALASVIQEYAYGRNPALGAVLADATHERALDIWETIPNHGLLPTTLSGLAGSHVKALSLIGRSEEVLEATARYIDLYEGIGEHENLASLKVLRIEALVNLRRIDAAAAELADESLFRDPIAGIEAKRLKGWVERYRRDPTQLPSPGDVAPPSPSSEDLLAVMKQAMGLGFDGEVGEELQKQADQLDATKRIDPEDPDQFNQLLDVLKRGEQFFTKGGADSDVAVRGKIREASAIFVHGTPGPEEIERALADLESGLVWAKSNGITELENDALWGIYLCQSRLQHPSEAADALIALRSSLERLRRGIADPLKRGGVFGTYRYLFNVMCEQLYKADRTADLLEAIESSKGRVIADRLTAQTGEVVEDAAIYDCVARLPELVQREKVHYLTCFVDETCVYMSFVTKRGEILAVEPIAIPSHDLSDADELVAPLDWGQPLPAAPGTLTQIVGVRLAPLVSWLDSLLQQGVVEQGDHICYSSDNFLHNIPIQYLKFRDGILADCFSVSRIHSAFHLNRVLAAPASTAPDRYTGFVVPLAHEVEEKVDLLANLEAPLQWLDTDGLSGEIVRLGDATVERVEGMLLDNRIVHFSTHGWFPRKGNPFHDSYLLLADELGLPQEERVTRGDHSGRLTPRRIVDAGLDFSGSHVSMMACLSGLAKEGVAGDSLGLDWALIQAGASSLISTHWEVSASCAARFFTLFYTKWIDGNQTRASALRETMLELLDGESSPESLERWTAFSLTGDFR